MDRLPTFLIIGAEKAGTSSLYAYLRQHPDIFMSLLKEPQFFMWEGQRWRLEENPPVVVHLDDYKRLFRNATGERALGEASAPYLANSGAPECIKNYIPEVRLIAILRDPVDRAYSAWAHARREGLESVIDFGQVVEAKPSSQSGAWQPLLNYLEGGFYAKHLERYLEFFDSSQIRVYLYDDLASRPLGVLRDMFGFLGVDDGFVPDMRERYNVGALPRSTRLQTILREPPDRLRSLLRAIAPAGVRRRAYRVLYRLNASPHRPLPAGMRSALRERYRDDIAKLSAMLARDLSHWLEDVSERERDPFTPPGIHPRLCSDAPPM